MRKPGGANEVVLLKVKAYFGSQLHIPPDLSKRRAAAVCPTKTLGAETTETTYTPSRRASGM